MDDPDLEESHRRQLDDPRPILESSEWRTEARPVLDQLLVLVAKVGEAELTVKDSTRLAWHWRPLKALGWKEVFDAWVEADYPAKWPPDSE